MTGPDRADTTQMRTASEAIEGTYQRMQRSSGQIVELLGKVSASINSPETSQTLRQLGQSLTQSDTAIYQRLQEASRLLGDSAASIEQILRQSNADIEAANREVRANLEGGRYGSALGG